NESSSAKRTGKVPVSPCGAVYFSKRLYFHLTDASRILRRDIHEGASMASTAAASIGVNLSKSFTGRKKIRRSFGRIPEVAEMPNLIEVQRQSYENFLQMT